MVRPCRTAEPTASRSVDNPLGWLIGTQLAVTIGTTSLDSVDRLGQLKAAEDASIDFYGFIRSGYYLTRFPFNRYWRARFWVAPTAEPERGEGIGLAGTSPMVPDQGERPEHGAEEQRDALME